VSAYLPTSAAVVWSLAAVLVATLAAGLAISRLPRRAALRAAAWTVVVASTAFVERLTADQPAGLRMLALIGTLLYAMKAVVTVDGMEPGRPVLSPARWLGFAALWPGMRPTPFAAAGGPPLPGARALLERGVVRLVLGVALVAMARLAWVTTGSRFLATALALPGLSFILHFGIFNLVAGAWRRAGVDVHALFRAPLLSKSLAEFWGRRWNLAFSEMTAIGVYRPLARLAGKPAALVVAFLFSGLLHELAISLPVRAGFGLPLLYFAIQGGLMLAERALERAGRPVYRRPAVGRAWTTFWLVAPLPILFHRPFLRGVVWPILAIAG
jgi:alginate O-acetyltransferase complex protein AlgI